jgi:hypothetical protein
MKHVARIALLATCFMLVSCLGYSSTLKVEETCSSGMSVIFNRIQGVISQKTELFIFTAVKTLKFLQNVVCLASLFTLT